MLLAFQKTHNFAGNLAAVDRRPVLQRQPPRLQGLIEGPYPHGIAVPKLAPKPAPQQRRDGLEGGGPPSLHGVRRLKHQQITIRAPGCAEAVRRPQQQQQHQHLQPPEGNSTSPAKPRVTRMASPLQGAAF